MMLENFRLRVFRAVAEQLNFRKAGEQLYLTQPAITLQVKALEEELGTRLFERGAGGWRSRKQGASCLTMRRRLALSLRNAENALAELKGEAAGELFLGASTTIAQYVLPTRLAAFALRFPSVHLRVASENTEQIVEGVASGCFGFGLIQGPALSRDVKVEPWFEDELVVVVPKSHEWAGQGSVSAVDLLTVPLVMRERGSGSRHVVEEVLQRAGLRLSSLKIVMELDSSEAILSCIEAGLGVGFASAWALDRRTLDHSLAKLRIDGHLMKRQFSFVQPGATELSAVAMTMKRFLQSTATL